MLSSAAATGGKDSAPGRASPLRPVNSALWFRFPRRVGALSPSMSVLLRDGDWTTSIPVLGAVVLPASLIAGMVVATSQRSPLWAYEFWPALVRLAIGALGAGPGVWAAFGYLIGLLFLRHDAPGSGLAGATSGIPPPGNGSFYSFAHATLPLIVVAIVLIQLAVIVPGVAVACRGLISRPLRRHPKIRTVAEGVLSTAIIALLAYQWQLAAPYAIRPFWTFALGQWRNVPHAPFDVLRSLGWYLCAVAVVVSVLRWAATLLLPRPAPGLARGTVKRIELPWPLTMAGQALVVTLLAAGVLATVRQGVVFFAVVAAGIMLRSMVLPRIPGFGRVVNLVPAAIRIVVLFVVAYQISTWRVGAAYSSHAHGLASFAETAGLVVLASAVVLVARRPRPWLPSWMSRRSPGSRDAPGVSGRSSTAVAPSRRRGAALPQPVRPGEAAGGRPANAPGVRPSDGPQHSPGVST
jgi:hypothetical protein